MGEAQQTSPEPISVSPTLPPNAIGRPGLHLQCLGDVLECHLWTNADDAQAEKARSQRRRSMREPLTRVWDNVQRRRRHLSMGGPHRQGEAHSSGGMRQENVSPQSEQVVNPPAGGNEATGVGGASGMADSLPYFTLRV